MNKKRAIQILSECAQQYERNLCGKRLLFVYGNPENPSVLSCAFYATHFLHLTGVSTRLKASVFYSACLNMKLSERDFELKRNGTTEQKLNVLPYIISIHRNARTIADFDGNGALLSTEKVVGNHTATLGLVSAGKFYVPNTVLQGNIKNFGMIPFYDLLAVLRKDISGTQEYEIFSLMRGSDEDQLRERLRKQGFDIL